MSSFPGVKLKITFLLRKVIFIAHIYNNTFNMNNSNSDNNCLMFRLHLQSICWYYQAHFSPFSQTNFTISRQKHTRKVSLCFVSKQNTKTTWLSINAKINKEIERALNVDVPKIVVLYTWTSSPNPCSTKQKYIH